MSLRRPARFLLGGVLLVLMLGVVATATNVVPRTRAGLRANPRPTANQLKPPQCAALNLTTIVVGSGTINGTGAANLMLGGAGADSMRGRGGGDCLVGGAGNDVLRGNGGTDVCLGGPGVDTFASCETAIQ